MDSSIEILTGEILGILLKIIPVVVPLFVIPSLLRYILGILEGDVYYSESKETQKETTPSKENETPVKIKTVNKARDIPRRCPYCYGILDNVDCCPYCGTEF